MPIVPAPPEPQPEDRATAAGDQPASKQSPAGPLPMWALAAIAATCCALGAGVYVVATSDGGEPTTDPTPEPPPENDPETSPEQPSPQPVTPPAPQPQSAGLGLREFDQQLQAMALRWGAATQAASRVRKARVAYQVRMSNTADDAEEQEEQLRVFTRVIDDGLEAIQDDRDEIAKAFLEIAAAWEAEPDVYGEQFDTTLETLRSAERMAEMDILLRFFEGIDNLPKEEESRRTIITDAWDNSYRWPEP